MPEKTKQQNPHKILVAAIDIGTTYSGYAYSFKDNWTKIKTSDWSNWNPMSHKAPTALLLNPDRTFNSFGYEAEKNYIDLLESGDKDYYFFQRFKMILETALEKRVNIKTKCMDENKKELDAIEVFTHCIRYLKDHLLENLNNTLINKIEVNNITFVITVPAIWDDVAKKFMRKAAEAAGIPSAQLLLALEPEAASIYFLFTQPDNQDGTRMKGMADTEYVILDIGGGKTDITVHQQQNHNLVELIPATGGAWGDTCVDKAFYIFLENIFGDEVLKRFSSEGEYKVDYFTFWQEFEKTKIKNGRRTCVRNNVRIHLPFVLLEIAKEVLNNKDMEEKEPINRCIENSKYRGKVRYQRGVLIVPSRIFDEIFHPMIRNITTHLEGIFRKESKYINTLLMVGGFAYNDVLRSEIREKFQDKRVVTPEQAELVVLKGAVYFGHIPDVFTTRVARYTYGIETCPRFDSFIHSLKKKEIISGEERSRDVFLKFISRGEYIEPGMRKSYIFQSRQNEERKVECGVFISNSEDPFYIDEKGCFKLGTIEIPICDRIVPAEIEMSFIFGETEIRVTASNFATGKQYEVKFDLLAEGIDMPDSRT
ncbi:heat shock 70 kDa protein 12B-like [Saccostrea cucullata]|uniref:heat shock 70 kDa protein 12B-like n=1 Tax=Saccostrea cuccullata TaxID=36930 RepID=UPI002ED2A0E8